MNRLVYFHLCPGNEIPQFTLREPFRAVIVAGEDVAHLWRKAVSDELVRSGCRYAMAWGRECSAWHDAIDDANLAEFDGAEIPDNRFVMTTWHEDESLDEVFWFCQNAAHHPSVSIEQALILDIHPLQRKAEMFSLFEAANALRSG